MLSTIVYMIAQFQTALHYNYTWLDIYALRIFLLVFDLSIPTFYKSMYKWLVSWHQILTKSTTDFQRNPPISACIWNTRPDPLPTATQATQRQSPMRSPPFCPRPQRSDLKHESAISSEHATPLTKYTGHLRKVPRRSESHSAMRRCCAQVCKWRGRPWSSSSPGVFSCAPSWKLPRVIANVIYIHAYYKYKL